MLGTALRLAAVLAFVACSGGAGPSVVVTANVTDDAITYAKLQNVGGLSLVGRSANTSGDAGDITGTDGQLPRVSGTTLGFGNISLSNAASVTGTLPIGNGGTNGTTAPSGFANLSPLTTKGDLLGFSTLNTRLAVGATGQIIRADSTAAAGLAWSYDHVGIPGATGAATGDVGEVITVTRLNSSGQSLSTGTAANVTASSITLTPGDWEVRAMVGFGAAASTTATVFEAAISKTSATFPASTTLAVPTAGETYVQVPYPAATLTGQQFSLAIPSYDVTVASGSTTPIFLVAISVFAVSTMNCYGWMQARRVR